MTAMPAIGSTVQLASGGQVMTVTEVFASMKDPSMAAEAPPTKMVRAKWMKPDGTVNFQLIELAALVAVNATAPA
jgi:uncharacterized protein YodC (DUF2158 family)